MVIKSFFTLFFFIVLSISVSYSQNLRQVQIDTIKRKAPLFELEDINFKKIKQTDLIGKIVVINFWGTRCAPCVTEIPKLNRVVKKFKSANVEFVAICPLNQKVFTIDKYGELRRFLKTNEFLYQICSIDDFGLLCANFDVKFVPTHFIIDKQGYLVYKYVGEISENELIKRISSHLNEF